MRRFIRVAPLALSVMMALIGSPPAAAQSGAPATTKAGANATTTAPEGMGLKFAIPKGWSLKRVDGHTVLLSGATGTEEWLTTVTISNQHNPASGAPSQGAQRMMTDYIGALRAKTMNYEVLREAPIGVDGEGVAEDGVQAVVRFQRQDGLVRQWVIIIPRVDISAAHVIIYSAPDDLFESGLPRAQSVVDTLTLLPARK